MPWIPALQKGDTIAIVAPAGRVLKKDLDFSIQWVKTQGWEVKIEDSIERLYTDGYNYAGTSDERISEFQSALDDRSVKAIWCARGGYGSIKIIDYLDFTKFKENPKWIIGYSDITVIHNKINALGFPSLHAVTAKQLLKEGSIESYVSLKKALLGESLSYTIPPTEFNKNGECKASIWGGNLSMLYSQLGSETVAPKEGFILFIEDWKEDWYHLDRMMMALKRSRAFDNVKALIVGSFTKMDTAFENPDFNNDFDKTANQIIASYFKEKNIPMVFNFPAGHIGDNRTLILNQESHLKVLNDSVILIFNHGRIT